MRHQIHQLCACILAALLTATPMRAQESAARLRVVDTGGLPIPFAVVNIGKARALIADDSGRLVLSASDDDSLRIRVRRIGYAEFYGPVPRPSDGQYVIILTPLPTQIAAVTVTERANTPLAMRGFYDRVERVRLGAIVGSFLTPEDLDEMNESSVSGILRHSTYARISRVRLGRGIPLNVVTGRGGCAMNIVVDGQLATRTVQELYSPGSINSAGTRVDRGVGPPMDIDELVDGRSVMAVEVYPSGANAPAELIPISGTGSCGIVAIWTGGRY